MILKVFDQNFLPLKTIV